MDEKLAWSKTLELAKGALANIQLEFRKQWLGGSLNTSELKEAHDLVTAADLYLEKVIYEKWQFLFPEHSIIAEEGSRKEVKNSATVWWIDPLDGTVNFDRQLEHWAISCGCSNLNKPVLGVLALPYENSLIGGGAGLGVEQDGNPLPHVSRPSTEKTWVIGTDWPNPLEYRQQTAQLMAALGPCIRQMRIYGSAVRAMVYCMQGKLDAYIHPCLFNWDVCAAAALLGELGWQVLDWKGKPWQIDEPSLLVCRPGMEDRLLARCTEISEGHERMQSGS